MDIANRKLLRLRERLQQRLFFNITATLIADEFILHQGMYRSLDRPLPVELKNRIDIYSRQRRENAAPQFFREIDGSTSFNALVRWEIKKGRVQPQR